MKTRITSFMLAKAIAPIRDSLNRSLWRRAFLLIALALACFAPVPQARADCPQGCDTTYGSTFFGESALYWDLGFNNTAIGMDALANNYEGNNNTATGYFALFGDPINFSNGNNNTATGAFALYSNTTGTENTAVGVEALSSNTTASNNVAIGSDALASNTEGSDNTATGVNALFSNMTGSFNTADGSAALATNTTGIWNTATGQAALNQNTIGNNNTADGLQALLSNVEGNDNTAVGVNALFSNTRGSGNIALGSGAGGALTIGSNNIDIGNAGVTEFESAKIRIGTKLTHKNTYIAGIYGVTVARGLGVIIDSSGHLGTTTSSACFKEAIKPMDKASEAILSLHPVTFRYKHELDPDGTPQFGLVAEEVAKVNADLVARDDEGKPYTVRYEAVNAMLLNEFLKEHRKVEEQEAAITELRSLVAQQRKDFQSTTSEQQKEINALIASLREQASQIQRVTRPRRGEVSKFATGRIRRGRTISQMVADSQ
jgi:hypothetical protein